MLDRTKLQHAFGLLGVDLHSRGLFIEIAVYGGSALMLQFEWRRSTEDVDAVVREGYDEALLMPSVAKVAGQLGLEEDWLNNAVGMFTPIHESEDLFDVAGNYPVHGQPGLRVLVATPRYMLAMKLQALRSLDRGDRDLEDARHLAAELGITDKGELHRLYIAVHGEMPHLEAASRFPSVLKRP